MSTEVYTLSTDLSSGMENQKLQDEINADEGIAPNATGIIGDAAGDTATIYFDGTLTGGEKTTLDGIIAAHDPSMTGEQISNISVSATEITNNNYVAVITFNFAGTDNIKNVSNFKVISYMDNGGTNYSLKLIDLTNNNTICTTSCSNLIDDVCDMGTVSNLPTSEAIFELQAKVHSTTVATIKTLCMYHD